MPIIETGMEMVGLKLHLLLNHWITVLKVHVHLVHLRKIFFSFRENVLQQLVSMPRQQLQICELGQVIFKFIYLFVF